MKQIKHLQDYKPRAGVALAISTILWTHLLFAPSVLFNALLYKSGGVLFYLYAPGILMIVALLFASALRFLNITGLYTAVLNKIEDLYRPTVAGWRRGVLRNIGYPAVLGSLALGVLLVGWLSVFGVIAVAINFWVLGGAVRGRTTRNSEQGEDDFTTRLTESLLDFYTKESDFKIKDPQSGITYTDNGSRWEETASHIIGVDEVEPDVFKVNFRNSGKTDEQFVKNLDLVATSLGVYDHEAMDDDSRAGFITVKFWMSPREAALAVGYPLWDESGNPIVSKPNFLPYGRQEDGTIVSTTLINGFTFVVGQQGSGKSVTERVIISRAAEMENVAIIGLDPKRVELAVWRDRASLIAVDRCCFPLVLDSIWGEVFRRSQVLEDRGLQKIEPSMWAEFPPIFLVGDELREIFIDFDNPARKGEKSYNYDFFQRLVAFGRFVGMSILSATQRAKSDFIPTNFRELQTVNIVHKVKTESDVRMAFGDLDTMPPANTLPGNQSGVGYQMTGDVERATKFRTDWLMTDQDRQEILSKPSPQHLVEIAENHPTVEEIVEATKHLRVTLPFLEEDVELQQHLAEHREEKRRALAEAARIKSQ